MFLIKSIFWLGLAFVVIQPQNLDFNSKKDAINSAAIDLGQKALISQLNSTNCSTLKCSTTKTFLTTSISTRTPTIALPMQEAQSLSKAPIPLPRLKRTG